MSWPETTEHTNVLLMTEGFRNDLSFCSRPQNFFYLYGAHDISLQMTISLKWKKILWSGQKRKVISESLDHKENVGVPHCFRSWHQHWNLIGLMCIGKGGGVWERAVQKQVQVHQGIASHHWKHNKTTSKQNYLVDIHPLSSMKLSHLINLFIQLVLQWYFLITAARTSLQGCLSYYSKWCWIKKKGEYSTALNLRTAVKHFQKCNNGVLRCGFLCIRHSGKGEYSSAPNERAEVRHLHE